MKHFAVIDTNVIVAAHLSSFDDSAVVEVFSRIISREDGAYLVTGNKKHFPKDPIVVTAAEFLNILDNEIN